MQLKSVRNNKQSEEIPYLDFFNKLVSKPIYLCLYTQNMLSILFYYRIMIYSIYFHISILFYFNWILISAVAPWVGEEWHFVPLCIMYICTPVHLQKKSKNVFMLWLFLQFD